MGPTLIHMYTCYLPPQLSRLGTQGPVSLFVGVLCYYLGLSYVSLGGGLRFFLFFLAFILIAKHVLSMCSTELKFAFIILLDIITNSAFF